MHALMHLKAGSSRGKITRTIMPVLPVLSTIGLVVVIKGPDSAPLAPYITEYDF
jgi:hypothetical protein